MYSEARLGIQFCTIRRVSRTVTWELFSASPIPLLNCLPRYYNYCAAYAFIVIVFKRIAVSDVLQY